MNECKPVLQHPANDNSKLSKKDCEDMSVIARLRRLIRKMDSDE